MFEDRLDAGFKLCPKLKKYSDKKDVIVVGLTRGGVITAKAISDFLHLKLYALVVKKISAPENKELAIGAMASKTSVYWNREIVKDLKLTKNQKEELIMQKEKEIKTLTKFLGLKTYKKEFKNKRIILVDDGVATGATVVAASLYLKSVKVKKIIISSPVIAYDTFNNIKKYFDNIICLIKSGDFYAVGQFYKNFPQISDQEVARILTI